MNGPKFIVTGCSRSGTAYTAKLFSALGFSCGHEAVFNIYNVCQIEDLSGHLASYPHRRGDSSFLSVPFLRALPAGTVVLHQVRHPVAVIRSHIGIRFFAEDYQPSMYLADNHPDFLAVIRQHSPGIFADTDELRRTMRYWVSWNRMAEAASGLRHLHYVRYQVEALRGPLLKNILELLDVHLNDDVIEQALTSVPRTTNTRPRDEEISWDSLPDGKLKDEIRQLAIEYQYREL